MTITRSRLAVAALAAAALATVVYAALTGDHESVVTAAKNVRSSWG